MKTTTTGMILLWLASVVCAQQPEIPLNRTETPKSLKARIDSLRVEKVAWREITWKSCLLEGLKESRERSKPVLLWVFIDRPADDARC